MQIILRSKKEIHYATEIEKILKAMYPKFAIKVKIFPIKRKEKRKFIVNTNKEKIKQQKGKIIGIKPKDKEQNKKVERKIYDIAFIDFMEDKLYKEEKNEDEMSRFVDKYKVTLDKQMNEVIGTSSEFMQKGRPESLLTNLTSDVMKAYGDQNMEGGADVSIMNVNGHRSTLPKGDLTLGNLFEVYSFDNTITFLEVKGEDLIKIFEAYARIGGAGISSNARLTISDRKLKSASLDGKSIEIDKIYNVVTIDYLADGNDNMKAFQDAVSINNTGITLRDVMIDYVREQTAEGKQISSQLDGRITIE